ncbi:hypothetical protein RJT34_23064 [Clitoria ternatea]|uniref:Uncharacterized protein n=1 Tax=Clitoria ternatea TaxID=43366 RepID=A0AAN9FKA0_CLITE
MEGDRRKRKMEEEEENEERQMEKFFALVNSTKDVRDRLSKEKEEEKLKGVWKPTFQPEDFINDQDLALPRIHVLNPPSGNDAAANKESPAGTAHHENETKKKGNDDDLDLTLSL